MDNLLTLRSLAVMLLAALPPDELFMPMLHALGLNVRDDWSKYLHPCLAAHLDERTPFESKAMSKLDGGGFMALSSPERLAMLAALCRCVNEVARETIENRLDEAWAVQREAFVREKERESVATFDESGARKCERSADCVRGYKHGGRGGLCSTRVPTCGKAKSGDVSESEGEEEEGDEGDGPRKRAGARGLVPTGIHISREELNETFSKVRFESGAQGARLLATDCNRHRYYHFCGAPLIVLTKDGEWGAYESTAQRNDLERYLSHLNVPIEPLIKLVRPWGDA